MIFRKVGFIWKSFVKSAAQIRAQQKIENMTKISISDQALQRPIFGLHSIPCAKLKNIWENL